MVFWFFFFHLIGFVLGFFECFGGFFCLVFWGCFWLGFVSFVGLFFFYLLIFYCLCIFLFCFVLVFRSFQVIFESVNSAAPCNTSVFSATPKAGLQSLECFHLLLPGLCVGCLIDCKGQNKTLQFFQVWNTLNSSVEGDINIKLYRVLYRDPLHTHIRRQIWDGFKALVLSERPKQPKYPSLSTRP